MSNEKNETLKPGDRVRLTGWADLNDNWLIEKFSDLIGKTFHVQEIRFYGGVHKLGIQDRAALDCFTYEKIQDDGNG